MKLTTARPEAKPEPTISLNQTKPGDCIRFAHDTVEEAFKCDLFWMRLDAPEAKDRIRLVNLTHGKQIERDGDHRCIVHECELHLTVKN